VLGFSLSDVANIFTLMILYGFCLMRALLCDEIIHLGNFESHLQIAGWRAPGKIAKRSQRLVFLALHFPKIRLCRKFPGGTAMSL
jgi:hypothetical protein